jgi:hypothetical protein
VNPERITADTITDDQIRALCAEAVTACDWVLAHFCDLALGRIDDVTPDRKHWARERCAYALRYVYAMEGT